MSTNDFRRPGSGRRRPQSYSIVTGFIVGSLVTGLLLPLVVDRRSVENAAATSSGIGAGTGRTSGDVADDTPSDVGSSAPSASSTTVTAPAGGGGSAGAPAAAANQAAPLTATDVGVSASTILVGAVVQDVGGVGKAGFGAAAGLSPQQQQSAYDAFFNALNAHGGINGRKVVGTYATVDITNADSYRAACLNFTQDKKVFAVLAGPGFQGGTQCVAIENRTPLIIAETNGIPTEWVSQAGGRLASVFAASQRMMNMFVDELDRQGLLRGKTLGILADQSDAGKLVVDTGLIPALKQKGLSAKYITRLSADAGTAASQLPIEVQQMRNAGVNAVLVTATVLDAVEFAQAADSQGYRPKYLNPDWGSTSDAGDENMPSSYDGVLISALSTYDYNVGRPDNPATTRCRQIYESTTHDKLTRQDRGSALRMDFTLHECDLVDIFARAAQGAGPTLTRASFVRALQGIGPIALSANGPGSFGPGKLEYSDRVRANIWNAGCKCWKPTASF